MSLRYNQLESTKVEMFDAETHEFLDEFDSLAKAARRCGLSDRTSSFNTKVYGRKIFDISFNGKVKKVYFKEK